MKFLKNTILSILIFSMIFCFNIPTYAKEINEITENNISATVLQVLDGDTIQVKLPNNDTAYVKLKGVNTKGFDTSYEYLTSSLLGQNVTLTKDGYSYDGSKFNYMIVYCNGRNINNELIQNGYAVIDTSQGKTNSYNNLLASQDSAKQNSLGMWRFENNNYSSITGSSSSNIIQTNDKVNINTATKSQLEKLLKGISSDLSREIIKYREKNPFSNIQEIKFVKGFTKKIYDQNKHALTVCTNINKANEFELKTLNELSDDNIQKIMNKRDKKEFTSVSDLSSVISKDTYNKISDYISTKDVSNIDVSKSYARANISLSSKYYLTNADVSYYLADDIINYRKNGYTYKTLMEISKLGTNNITEQDIHYLQDNLNVFTNLNTENIHELNSVFSKTNAEKIKNKKFYQKSEVKDIIGSTDYDKFKDALCVDKNKDEYVNINTATKEQMYAQGINSTEAYNIIQKRPIRHSGQLPFNVSHINNKISLYTNINTASKLELRSLNNGISDTLIDKIIKYREDDNFGSLQELEEFFKANNASNVYNNIKSYIVVR
ncbi:helix-hairpin-helix domain-containing protein [[Clostridium] colinum]|uniref:helix-hairpin-helix domain-containing protein n=1 Tax=[Clostridium] colinum TaxID=36835 RepID=UPI00202486C2|nr:helix-hairpin-helix domain-containing protein [[Clostridium] colinum]